MFKFWKKKTGQPDQKDLAADPPSRENAAESKARAAREAQVYSLVDVDSAASVEVADGFALTPLQAPEVVDATVTSDIQTAPSLLELGATDASVWPPPKPLDAAQPKRSWRERFAGSILNRDIRTLFARNPPLDEALLDELETILIGADVGVNASTALIDTLRIRMAKREFADAHALLATLREDLVKLLLPVAKPLQIDNSKHPFVILMVGVNGVGKTTTIGKLSKHLQTSGHSVMLAAGDTFRAAAVEQLKTWGERNQITVVAQGPGADSASVIFDALQSARSKHVDVLIADTAGRLHTQIGLMDELAKIRRVLAKIDAEAPHEVLLVIDGTTGQNAVNQTRQFRAAIGVTGLAITKLDGSAKGGVVFALAKEFALPIRYVGLGENLDDLRAFDAHDFVDALLPATLS